jgi:glycosyltransferase involved in cell wall biosynthesis
LQDEEIWINTLSIDVAHHAWESIEENAQYVDRFITSSTYYKAKIERTLTSIKEIEVVYPGVNTQQYESHQYPKYPTIGFFYRMNEQNGLHILAKAFVLLKKTNRMPRLKLLIGGGYTSEDKKFLGKIRKIVAPYKDDVEWYLPYSLMEHAKFYSNISALSVPITFEESAGLYLCEAFAAGRPVIEPETGSFAEMVGDGGGLYAPNTHEALADAIEELFADEAKYKLFCKNARCLSQQRYHETLLSEWLQKVYSDCIGLSSS